MFRLFLLFLTTVAYSEKKNFAKAETAQLHKITMDTARAQYAQVSVAQEELQEALQVQHTLAAQNTQLQGYLRYF
jgi:hypothetical protein